MKQVDKEYVHPFLLEPTKLRRIVDTIHASLAAISPNPQHDTFELFLTGNRREEVATLDGVLAIDNSRKHKIERLVILSSVSAPGAAKSDHEVQVDFGGPSALQRTPGTVTKVVSISVRSDAPGWNSRTLAEIEEQVERTWLHRTGPLTGLIILLVAILVALLSQFVTLTPLPLACDSWWLNQSDLARLETMLKDHAVLTDDNLREIETRQLRNVLDARGPRQPTQVNPPLRVWFLAVAFIGIIVCIVILLTCYPAAVFLWGDEVDRYANLLQRRKITWGIIVSVTVVSFLSRSLFEGVSSLFSKP